jgi:excinuclease ABC subunit C
VQAEQDHTAKGPTGHVVVQGYLKTIDSSPGVYRMLDAVGQVLYVGKARNLKARVSSYARPTGHSGRIARMIGETASMMFLTTRTETEALLLEQNLIKQLKPRFNVLLRDDKSFPNILIAKDHAFPQIRKHRGKRSEKGAYFGPFASAGAVNRTLNQLQKVFLLRTCTDAVFESRTRPCLLYQIKRCSAPCVGKVGPDDYATLVGDAELFLQGKTTTVQADLALAMAEASAAMEFERAAALRDRIRALTQVQSAQGINPRGVSEADVIALHLEGGQACVQVFFIRANQSWGNRDFYPRTGAGAEEPEILEAFLAQFYDDKDPPRLILLSHPVENEDLVTQLLSDRAGRKVELAVPRRGEKAELVQNAARNARESLARKMAEGASQNRLLAGLAEAFDLEAPPKRIEVYDNSHIQGTNAVGGMIVAGPDGFLKSQYRKFNIRSDAGANSDDFGMMKEVLTRRFDRLLKEDPDRSSDAWPDLLLIDGGAGQVSAVPHTSPVLYFVQRLRDEAHRWAIGAHRAKRAKAVSATPLDDIPGVGATRKRALLAHFGSAKAVGRAAVGDLTAVDGISDTLAQSIYDFFHARG